MINLIFLSPNIPFIRLLAIMVFFFAASLTPFIGLLFLMTLPMILFVLCILNDQTKILTAFLGALCIMAVILVPVMHTMLPVLALAAIGLAGILMARTAKNNYSVEALVLLPSLVILAAIAAYFIYGGMQLSISPWQLVEKHITEAVELNIKFYNQLPLSPEEINAIKDGKPLIIQLFTRIFPALCIISVLFATWANALMGNKLLHKQGAALPQLSALSQWKAPHWLVWIFIAAGGLSFVPETSVRYSGINIVLIASFIYFLQGLAIVSFFFQSKNISLFFRWIFYFLIAIQQMLMIAIATMGFADLWIDFRKYLQKPPSTD